MKINNIEIRQFATGKYTEEQTPAIDNLDGDDLLIKGDNKTGKTLTFNALIYGILGREHTFEVSSGHGNHVTIGFTDGSELFRGEPTTQYSYNDTVVEADEADSTFLSRASDNRPRLLKQFFLHSNIEQLPLEVLSGDEIVQLIQLVTDSGRQSEIEETQARQEDLNAEIEAIEESLVRLEDDKSRLDSKIGSQETQAEKLSGLIELGESGRLAEIKETLEEDEELEEQLTQLMEEKGGIQQKIEKAYERKKHYQTYEEEVNDIIIEAVTGFVCPACNESVPSSTAEGRLGNGRCPFCARDDTSIDELKNSLHEKKSESEGVLEDIEEEIEKLETEREQIDAEILEVQEQQPILEDLNPDYRRRLENHSGDIDSIVEEARQELESVEDAVADQRQEQERIAEEIENKRDRLEEANQELEDAQEYLQTLKNEEYEENLSRFEQRWSEIFRGLSSEIGQEVGIDIEGEITLPGDPDNRKYEDRGALSSSEVQLVNISFAICILEEAHQSTDEQTGPLNWGTVVLDEPFSRLDDANTREVIGYLTEEDIQFVISSSDTIVWDQFDERQTIELERGTIQRRLGNF